MSPKLGARRRLVCLASASLFAFLALLGGSAAAATETPGETFAASASPSGQLAEAGVAHASISADGQQVAFVSSSTNLDPESTTWGQAYVKDLETGAVTIASRGEGVAGPPAGEGGGAGVKMAILATGGRYLVFQTGAENIVAGLPSAPGPIEHVYRRDLQTGETTLVDRTDGAEGEIVPVAADLLAVSADGNLVAFSDSAQELEDPAAAHPEGEETIYVRDLATGTTTEIAAEGAEEASFSADDRYLLFTSAAPSLPESTGIYEVYRRDLTTGESLLVSRGNPTGGAPTGEPADGEAYEAVFVGSSDCEVAFFADATTNLDSGGAGPPQAVYVRDFCASPSVTALVSVGEEGVPFGAAFFPSTTADGQIAFVGQTNAVTDPSRLYLRDLVTQETTLLGRATGPEGEPAERELSEQRGGMISANGCRGIFTTDARDLVEEQEELPFGLGETFVRQVAPCIPPPPSDGNTTGTNPAGNTGQGSGGAASGPALARTLSITGFGKRGLWLAFDGAGRSRVRIQRQAPGGGWKLVKSFYVNASSAGVVRTDVPRLRDGRYRFKVRLQGDPDNPTLTRRLLVSGGRP